MRKTNWEIGEEHNGWVLVSKDPHVTPNGSKRYHVTVRCPNCGYVKTVTSPISKLNNRGCPHKGMGIRKEQRYERVYKYSGDGDALDTKVITRLGGALLKEVDHLSNKLGVSRSGVVRQALIKFVENRGNN